MSYHYGTKADGAEDEWFDGPEVLVLAKGAHDCSRLIQALRSGNSEQASLGLQIAASLNRSLVGRRVTELLKRHGGEVLTAAQLDRRSVMWAEAVNTEDGGIAASWSSKEMRFEQAQREADEWCARFPQYEVRIRRQSWWESPNEWETVEGEDE